MMFASLAAVISDLGKKGFRAPREEHRRVLVPLREEASSGGRWLLRHPSKEPFISCLNDFSATHTHTHTFITQLSSLTPTVPTKANTNTHTHTHAALTVKFANN